MTTGIKVTAPTIDELKAKIAAALKAGDDAAFMQAVAELNKNKAEIAKAAAELAKKEVEAFAGKRTEAEKHILELIKGLKLDSQLTSLKVRGFHYFVAHKEDTKGTWTEDGEVQVKQSVGLAVPAVKGARKSSGGGNTGGKSKDEFGMSLDEIFTKFRTTYLSKEDAAAYDVAEAATPKDNSKLWQLKTKVKKAAIAAGVLAPVK